MFRFKHYSLTVILFAALSCSPEPVEQSYKNATDCTINDTEGFQGICLNGSKYASPDDVLTYASKATPNYDRIEWSIENGNLSIQSIEETVEEGMLKSIATLQFKSTFSGGSIRVVASTSNNSEFVEITNYEITIE